MKNQIERQSQNNATKNVYPIKYRKHISIINNYAKIFNKKVILLGQFYQIIYNFDMKCKICPRNCNIDRSLSTGFCGMGQKVKLAKADVFLWEEPVISGTNGSGAIFFSGCNLKCCFCQNYQISSGHFGKEISVQRLAKIFEELENKGVHNINLVSPTHFETQILEALKIYKPKVPVVWNSNGFETAESIKKLTGIVDIFLVDLKFFDNALSKKYCKADNYFEFSTKAILEMISQQPKVVIKNGIMQKGVIIRHMVMPNCTDDSKKVLEWIAKNAKNNALVSIMSQYTPCHKANEFAEINRKIKPIEYKIVTNFAKTLGIENGFFQEYESATQDFIPIWDLKGV